MENDIRTIVPRNITASIFKWLPFVPGIIIFFGMVRLMTFYSFFNINVLVFLTIRDALILSLDVSIFFVVVTFILLAYFATLKTNKELLTEAVNLPYNTGQVTREDLEMSLRKMRIKLFWRKVQYNALIIPALIYVIILVIRYIQTKSQYALIMSIVILVVWAIITIVYYLVKKVSNKVTSEEERPAIRFAALIFIAWTLYAALSGAFQAINILYGDYEPGVISVDIIRGGGSYKLPEDELSTNQKDDGKAIIIGRLQDFTFVYWKGSKKVESISNQHVKVYTIRIR